MKLGFEIHIRVPTKNKLFCTCLADKQTCFICLGLPGAKRKLNTEIFCFLDRFLTLFSNYTIIPETNFYRKYYLYRDLPKGYQITSCLEPLVKNLHSKYFRRLSFDSMHIEENPGQIKDNKVFYERSGNSLFELTTPIFNISSLEEVSILQKDIQNFLREVRFLYFKEIGDEDYHFKIDINISFINGDRQEIKNVGDLSSIREIISYELLRLKKRRGAPEKESNTRWWIGGKTIFSRKKETYFYEKEIELPEISYKRSDLPFFSLTLWTESLKDPSKIKIINSISNFKILDFILKNNSGDKLFSLALKFRYWDMVFKSKIEEKKFLDLLLSNSIEEICQIYKKLKYRNL